MKNKKLAELVEYLDYDELQKIQKDLTTGGMYLARLVEERIQQENKKHEVACTVCNAQLDSFSVSNFTLIFGPDDFKKKASFCALDCMEYFITNLKDLHSVDNDPHYNPAPALGGGHDKCGR